MSALSLSQYVASIGGIAVTDPALQGETDRLRELNTCLRGRNAIVRTEGRAYDVVAQSCIDEGYPIDESLLFDALKADAIAWSEGNERGRVYREYHLDDGILVAFDEEFESWLIESDRAPLPTCSICACVVLPAHAHAAYGERACLDCATWARGFTADESVAPNDTTETHAAHEALQEALKNFLDTDESIAKGDKP